MPMYDTSSIYKAGITPSSKILKYGNAIDEDGNVISRNPIEYNLNYGSLLDIMREQNFIETIERYQWVNIPPGLTQDLIERVLFYRGTGIFYFNKDMQKFQFLPYALDGNIDEYGRYLMVNTFPFIGVDKVQKKKKKLENAVTIGLQVVYDLPYNKDMIELAKKKEVGIILNDNSLSLSQQPVIRSLYVQPILHLLATLIQIINTAIFGSADHNTITVENESELNSINRQIEAINVDILNGKRFTAISSSLPIEPIKTSNGADLEGLFNTFNSVTNLLKSITGIANPGVFDKKAHLLQEEQHLNGSNADDIYYNGLRLRQEFCLMIQAYYGYPIWCESKRGMSEEEQEQFQMQEQGGNDNASDKQQKPNEEV